MQGILGYKRYLPTKIAGLEINNPEVVSKSYPHYWEDLKKVGFEISEE